MFGPYSVEQLHAHKSHDAVLLAKRVGHLGDGAALVIVQQPGIAGNTLSCLDLFLLPNNNQDIVEHLPGKVQANGCYKRLDRGKGIQCFERRETGMIWIWVQPADRVERDTGRDVNKDTGDLVQAIFFFQEHPLFAVSERDSIPSTKACLSLNQWQRGCQQNALTCAGPDCYAR